MMPDLQNPFTTARIVGKGVNPADYHKQSVPRGHRDYVMSRSDLCEFSHCPSRWVHGYQRKDSDATEWGTLLDAMLLDGNSFDDRFAVEPPTYPAEGGKDKKWNNNATYCKEWAAEQGDKIIVSAKDCVKANEAIEVLLSDPDIAQLLINSDKSVHVIAEYNDGATGLKIQVKALLDIVPHVDSEFGKALMDFKTASSAFPFVWEKSVFEHNYHVQAATYLDAYTLATGEDRTDWLHLIQESFAPWQVGKRLLSSEFLALGRMKLIESLRLYCACLHANHFPGYERDERKINWRGFQMVEPLPWMIGQ